MKYIRWAVIILILVCSGVVNAQDSPSARVLEDIVVNYMTAINKGEFEEVVSLLHPEAINNITRIFIREYEKALSEGRGGKFKNENHIDKSLLEIKKMESMDIAVYLLKIIRMADSRFSPGVTEKMNAVIVKATGKEKIDDYAYKVKFIMFPPDNSILQNGELIITKVNGAWKVYR